MSFIYDENDTGMKPLTDGEYEVYPNAFDPAPSQTTGNPMITMNYFVREDVQQAGAGSEIRYDHFTDTPAARWRFNVLTKATKAFNNKFDFGDDQGWAQQMMGRPVRVRIEMEKDSKGKERPSVKEFMPSQFPQMATQPKIKSGQQQAPISGGYQPQQPPVFNQQPAQGQTQPQSFGQPNIPNRQPAANPFANTSNGAIDISDDDLPF